jgi:tripartite-type tricarboxylate transporter receptor subunit TctC
VPTFDEQGVPGYEAYAWQGLVVPAATPATMVAELAKALQAALVSAPVKERFQALSLEALPGTPEQMEAYVASERERWGKVIRANGIRAD